jgi:hypothetical protein
MLDWERAARSVEWDQRPETTKMIRSLTRRLENLESRFEPAGEPVGEPTIINLNFVDKDLKVVNQMQMTVAAPPNDPGWRARAWRRSYR